MSKKAFEVEKEMVDFTFFSLSKMVKLLTSYYLAKNIEIEKSSDLLVIIEVSPEKWKGDSPDNYHELKDLGINSVRSQASLKNNIAKIKALVIGRQKEETSTDKLLTSFKIFGEVSELRFLLDAINFHEHISFWEAKIEGYDYSSERKGELMEITIPADEEFYLLEIIASLDFDIEEITLRNFNMNLVA